MMSVNELLASHKKVAPGKAVMIAKEQPVKRERVYGREMRMSGQEYARVVGGFSNVSVQKGLRQGFRVKKEEVDNKEKNVKIVQISLNEKKGQKGGSFHRVFIMILYRKREFTSEGVFYIKSI